MAAVRWPHSLAASGLLDRLLDKQELDGVDGASYRFIGNAHRANHVGMLFIIL